MTLAVGMIGFGAIGRPLAEYMKSGNAGGARLVSVLVRHPERIDRSEAQQFGCTFTADPTEFLATEMGLVIEAAGHEALGTHGPEALRSGNDLLVVSVGALADDALRKQLLDAARKAGRRVLIASGAIGALDAISAARVGGLDSVTHTTRKNPRTLLPPAEADEVIRSAEPRELYNGPAREGVRRFPENVNVAAAISLAGLGFDGTTLRIIADPAVTMNTHEVVVRGHFGDLRFEIRNIPSDSNPKTGRIVAMSLAKTLLNLTEPIVVGA